MFPYPSGSLHMGHLRVYAISDFLARFYKMRGFDVLHPMGWDAFGLPAENAAIERGVEPGAWTRENIARMKTQLGNISGGFDWDCELATCDPRFYVHTQRIFLMLFNKGLAYQAEARVNYDPVDKTVLANEQVDANGFSWRSGAKVQQLNLKQWFFRITEFKEELLRDLDSRSNGWPDRVLSMQRNWLGKSQGARVSFPVAVEGADGRTLDVFTTRPDTLYGVEYLALSLDHHIVRESAERDPALKKFLDNAASLPSDSKAGYQLSDVRASHPLRAVDKDNAHLDREIPVFAAPYVLSGYGEGAVMGVPGHDARDLVFYKENMSPESIPIVIGSRASDSADSLAPADDSKAFLGEGVLTARCGKYRGLHSREASKQIVADLKQAGRADSVEQWRLRDWLISRQRYWGTPIPIVHCGDCGPVPVPADQLPVELPEIGGDWLRGKRGNPLEANEEWVRTQCPSCGGPARRDTDTMDTFVDSSWYFLRFLDAKNKELPFSPSSVRPVDIYIGGVEHAILHLLYARFIYKALAQSELFPKTGAAPEPFLTLLSQGMVHGKTYSEPSTGRFLHPSEVDLTNPEAPLIKGTQTTPKVSFEKMSKSKHNGVDPTACVARYGADATRAHVLFSAPVSEVLEWDETKIVGMERWFGRLWRLVLDARQMLSRGSYTISDADLQSPTGLATSLPPVEDLADADADGLLATNEAIQSITNCIENNPYGLNTVISGLIKLTNALSSSPPRSSQILYACLSSHLRLLAPVAPGLSSECWEVLNAEMTPVLSSPWPVPLLTAQQVDRLSGRAGQTVAVQVNGKLRFTATIPVSGQAGPAADEWIVGRILDTDQGRVWLREKNNWETRRRVIVVKGGKLVNVVF
ncbi:hypothetical protein PHISP_02404 [Aspergillus sp. HF37]|nr:hypothetical protein PHISP_02404 [Aspergillus sp. HF37]